jgi:hypothetical protein
MRKENIAYDTSDFVNLIEGTLSETGSTVNTESIPLTARYTAALPIAAPGHLRRPRPKVKSRGSRRKASLLESLLSRNLSGLKRNGSG